jgi:hypothetical protein
VSADDFDKGPQPDAPPCPRCKALALDLAEARETGAELEEWVAELGEKVDELQATLEQERARNKWNVSRAELEGAHAKLWRLEEKYNNLSSETDVLRIVTGIALFVLLAPWINKACS